MTKLVFTVIWIISILCGPINSGISLAYSSSALKEISFILSFKQISYFTSSIFLGGLIGSLIIGHIMDKYGRKFGLVASTIPGIIGWLLIHWYNLQINNIIITKMRSSAIDSLPVLYLGRMLSGMSCGMNMAATTVYLVESSSSSNRGSLASINQLGITLGILLCYMSDYIYHFFHNSAMHFCIFPVVLFCSSMWFKESPVWYENLYKKHKITSTFNIYSTSEENIIESSSSIKKSNKTVPIFSLFAVNYSRKSILVIGVMLIQQMTGINVVISYAGVLFNNTLDKWTIMNNLSVWIGATQFVFTCLSTAIFDRFPRKTLLKFSSLAMGIGLFLSIVSITKIYEILLVFGMIVYMIGFSMGWGPVPVILCSEMFYSDARSSASALAVMMSWVGGFFITFTYPIVTFILQNKKDLRIKDNDYSSQIIFSFYCLICFAAYPFVSYFVPETKGVSLDNPANNMESHSMHCNNDIEYHN